MSTTITVNVKAPGATVGTQDVEVERYPGGWITTGVRPADEFKPGPVDLTLLAGPDGVGFVEGEYEATIDFVDDPPSREHSRVLFVGPK